MVQRSNARSNALPLTWRTRSVLLVIFTIVLGMVVLAIRYGGSPFRTIRIPIQGSLALDIRTPERAYGYADFVFVATVTEEIGIDDGTTLFRVLPVEVWEGRLPRNVVVAQTGRRIGNVVWEREDQPFLEVGATYVFAANAEDDAREALTILAGPHGATKLADRGLEPDPRRLADLRARASAQIYPEGTPLTETERTAVRTRWETLHAGNS